MAPELKPSQPKRERAPRLTPAEKNAKRIANIDMELSKAGLAVVNAADGLVRAGRRDEAKRCLDLWAQIIDIGAPPAPNSEPPAES